MSFLKFILRRLAARDVGGMVILASAFTFIGLGRCFSRRA